MTRAQAKSQAEVDLLRAAREFEKHEEDKSISNFICIGKEQPTDIEIQHILDERRETEAAADSTARAEDRSRRETSKQVDRIAVPFAIHPLYAAASGAGAAGIGGTGTGAAPTDPTDRRFAVTEADRILARRTLLNSFVAVARTVLQIGRVEGRLRKAKGHLIGETKNHGLQPHEVPHLHLFEFALTPSNPLSLVAPPVAALSDQKPAVSRIDTFEPLDLKVPLNFKLSGYTPHPLVEHPFMCADPTQPIQVLPFGLNEPTAEDVIPLPDALRLPDFQQPSFSNAEQFPVPPLTPLPFLRVDLFPYDRLQIEDSAGAKPPFFSYDFGHEGRLPPNTINVNGNADVWNSPLPALLQYGRKEDVLSDTDDEDAPDVKLDIPHPTSLADVVAAFGGPDPDRHFLLSGTAVSEDPCELVTATPMNTFASESLNELNVKELDGVYAEIRGFLAPHRRKLF
eukprot:NODE_493_length_1608_cov_272.003207_g375_i0.p1 GENE.NODE_493_length_1608_cov_272.003207_g375_i0~~NODE_493_length_1608_cov_272.003207_g375_i0.p1  ORF type:complete len:455 (-),score=108.63 NODE_493_length_1608_cov_272.003207_g375_i0:126-1490(-)